MGQIRELSESKKLDWIKKINTPEFELLTAAINMKKEKAESFFIFWLVRRPGSEHKHERRIYAAIRIEILYGESGNFSDRRVRLEMK